MPRLIGIFAAFFLLFSCQQKEDSANQMKQMEKPDSQKELGSSVSPQEKIEELTAIITKTPISFVDSQISIRLELVKSLNKNKKRDEAKFQLDTISNFLVQKADSQSISFIKAQNLLGEHYHRIRDYSNASAHYQAGGLANQNRAEIDTGEFVKSFINAGVVLADQRKYKEAYDSYLTALPFAEAQIDTRSDRIARVYNNIGLSLSNQLKPYQAIPWFEKSLIYLQNNFPEDYAYLYRTYLYKGDLLILLGSHNEAIDLFEKALEFYKKKEDKRQLAEIYLRIGRALRSKNDIPSSLAYFQQSVKFYEELGSHPFYRRLLASVHMSIGNALRADKQFEEGHKELNLAREIYREIYPENHSTFSIVNLNQGLIYYNQNELSKAEDLLIKSRDGYIENYGKDSPYLITLYYALGALYEKYEKWGQADLQYQLAIKIAKENYGNRHYYTARTLANMAELDFKLGNYSEAIKHIQDALICLFPDLSSEEIYKIPQVDGSIASAGYAIEILQIRAQFLAKIAEVNHDEKALTASHKTYGLTQDLVSRVRSEMNAGSAKLTLQEQNYRMYEEAIDVAWRLYQKTGDQTYLEEAFYIAERSKANLLMEALQESEAKEFAGIPKPILDLENEIKKSLTDIDKKIFDVKQGETKADEEEVKSWETERFALKQSYDSLKQRLGENYPDYYRLKYDQSLASLDEIQKNLPQKAGLIEYFVGDSSLYVFYLSKKNYQALKIPVNPLLEKQVQDVREGISQWYFDTRARENDLPVYFNRYRKEAEKLYSEIINPIKEKVADWPEKLIFVPDGILGYLPFESLLTQKSDLTAYASSLPYLIKDQAISYAYSSTSWLEIHRKKGRKSASGKLIAFAPSFGNGNNREERRNTVPSDYFSPLKYNQEEVQNIINTIEGDSYLKERATLENFINEAPNFQMIHLASHGKAHDKDSRYSFIAFADPGDSAQKRLLYVSDLYNIQLNADLVVLSACETGIGKLYRGEGIASLARAFTYAGAKSIATTLWRVDDQASSVLMTKFYEFLNQGMTKDEALQKAKIFMIEEQYDPFYWAGYIAIGEMEPIDQGNGIWLWLLIGAVVLGLGGFVGFRLKK